jgi:hypothetical protein
MTLLFLAHYIADFLLQSREMGQKKSKDYVYLFAHTWIIFSVISLAALCVFDTFESAIKFSFWNAILHMAIDAISWRAYGYCLMGRKFGFETIKDPSFNFKEKAAEVASKTDFLKDEWFMRTLGADQIAHMIVLYELYELFR